MRQAELALNPWISMWNRPRATVRALVENDPRYLVLALAGLAGVRQVLDEASVRDAADALPLPVIVGLAVVLGPPSGILTLHISGALIHWTGRWLGGSAPASHLRTALAWGSLPMVAGLVLWIPALGVFREELFTMTTPRLDANLGLAYGMIAHGLVSGTLGVWALVLMLKAIGEVQGFSAWRAMANVLLAAAVVTVPIVVFFLGIAAA